MMGFVGEITTGVVYEPKTIGFNLLNFHHLGWAASQFASQNDEPEWHVALRSA
jgi:hypothetical protein